MREPINVVQVEKAYPAVYECLRRVEEHFTYCAGLQGKHPIGAGRKVVSLPAEVLGAIVGQLEALRPVAEEAERMLAALDHDLPALQEEPVKAGNVVGSSWAEAVVLVARTYVAHRDGWGRFGTLDAQGQQKQFSDCFQAMPDVRVLRARLKIEAARLRDRAVALDADARYGFVLGNLTPQSRRLMQMLIDREGRAVEYQEIAEALWGDGGASNGRIQKAMHRLKRELEGLGSGETGREIRSEAGAYRFR